MANQIGLNNPTLIVSWMKRFREDGSRWNLKNERTFT
ncbi:hypothetical protein JI640_00520 [Listeria ivanovii subsp. londoniensis]|nr:hypothetical protein [Listeria ivanovii subsp. londoniensis]MBK1984718.1 hypothetical protein [Listeria ivanovii subsp. londoniensis]MBK1994431.1 hypothetical protein [Listeria ivanovii subsp. londoniensis]